MAKYRDKYPDYLADQRKRFPSRAGAALDYEFIGVDGEGWTDDQGHHHYMCLIVGEHVLYTGQPLGTLEVLNWLMYHKKKAKTHHVSFYFDYDVTMILKDMVLADPEFAKTLFIDPYNGFRRYKQFAIRYIPRKSLTICGPGKLRIDIHDVGAFFQCSFVKALTEHNIGSQAERDAIAAMKEQRGSFDIANAKQIIAYSKDECRLLSQLVRKLQDDFIRVGMNAYPFEGPGPVANKALTRMIGKEHKEHIPPNVWDFAQKAYYGGRFEITKHGTCHERIYEYDIKSAYPDAMTYLPCLLHGKWERRTHRMPLEKKELWVGFITWKPKRQSLHKYGVLGPFPFRMPDGSIVFPLTGSGWYWSPEVMNALEDYDIMYGEHYVYHKECQCEPFNWIPEWFKQKADLEAKAKGSGIAVKLTLNSLYGKFAQTVGKPAHYNPVYASLITSITRAKIYSVYRNHSTKVVMFATDAVFTTEECTELDLGKELGQWELEGPFDDFCIFLPGLYFDGDRALFKTRGVPKRMLLADPQAFREAANDHTLVVPLTLQTHQGIRLTLQRGKNWYHSLGDWISQSRNMSANPATKREPTLWKGWSKPYWSTGQECTMPYKGGTSDQAIALEDQEQLYDGIYDAYLDNGAEDD